MSITPTEVLTSQQESFKDLISKAYTNFKKSAKARLTRGYLEARLTCIDDYWQKYQTGHQHFFKITTQAQRSVLPYFTEDRYSECEDIYLNMKADMTDILLSLNFTQPSTSTSSPSATSLSVNVKLPTINLPSYSGAYEEWQSFEDTFISLIDSNPSLSDVQKLHYLKSCVTGEAKNTIRHFQVTEKNYGPTWECLKDRYSQKRLIVNAILKRLLSLKKINAPSSLQLKNLIDNTKECLNSLKSLSINIDSWDPIIIFLTIQKLDQESHREWETYVSGKHPSTLPTLQQLNDFLESRICTLELTSPSTSRDKPRERTYLSSAATMTKASPCNICKEEHLLYHCKEFGKWSPDKRCEYAREHHLCFNCLSAGHSMYNCKHRTTCRICGRKHHSLLHTFKKIEASPSTDQSSSLHTSSNEEQQEEEEQKPVSVSSHYSNAKCQRALLATAIVPVRSSSGHVTVLRALVDQGSQVTLVSERAAQLLKLKRQTIRGTITGVGSTKTSVSHVVQLEVQSRYDKSFNLPVKAYVLSTQLTAKLPSKPFRPMKWSHLDGLNLADPEYFSPGKIDMLLGIDVYTEILKNNLIKGPPGTPCAQETSLGWILFGNINDIHSEEETVVLHHHLDIDIHDMLTNMWDVESVNKRRLTAEEKLCEEIYVNTHSRTPEGRYIVKIPFKSNDTIQQVGETRDVAQKRFNQLERNFERNPELKKEYVKVIEEYIELNHMEEIPEEEKKRSAIYLPHHAVIREDKETTKLRVVFDGSCKGSNNKSLNDEQLVGAQLQEDLRSLVMRWRMKPVCFVADVQKMYRQILVAKEDADYQRILWRKDKTEDLREYRLLRVTFGTSSAPYLAVRMLMQLAEDEGKNHAQAAKIIKEDFFVDDCISGCSTLKEAIEVSKDISHVLSKGGLELQKWASNSTDFIKQINPSLRCANATKDIMKERTIKTLGLTWNMASDSFHYQSSLPPVPKTISKRSVLAEIQRLFDPLGWLGPAIILAKMLIQKLWIEGCNWDDILSKELEEEWLTLRESFEHLKEINIDRYIHTREDSKEITLHGFCDASNKAYCAVIYCRVVTSNDEIKTSIVASRTRVAPIRPVSIPRLELLGALLLAQLLSFVRESMRISNEKVYAWTDSSIVLSWLNGDPNRWKTYVSNRVVEILEHTNIEQWYHVTSDMNPADLGSRGMLLPQLVNNELWWKGPEWLRNTNIEFTKPNIATTDLEGKKKIQINLKVQNTEKSINFNNFDSLDELLRVITYSKRFINSKKKPETIENNVTTEEMEEALLTCVRIAQRKEYKEEIDRLKGYKIVRKNSNLKSLNPYLDNHDILRVGGRLSNSDLQEQTKHPIILGTKNELTPFILAEAHKRTLHGGIQLMLCYLRSKYWIIHAKNAVKAHIHKCLVCARIKAVNRTQIMGNLPKVRITQARPFLHSGVDFAGPLLTLMSKGRGAKLNKSYIAIFICMATKAIHLELVGDLTSESFIGAFHRFIARRGRCTHVWSDQGRNFVGANKELANAFMEARLELPGDLAEKLASDGTQWHFIPPYSPNFGGLWEAGVKSVKHHLKRILTASLTFEEMTTVLCQIEACLNSRPLTPIDTVDTDLIEPLTPGHFLIGEAPVTIPNPNLQHINVGRLSRWQLTQKLVRDFWHKWQMEYLTRLQQRPKWLKQEREFEIGDIVLLKEDQLPPGKWSLGRIIDKHPGKDNITRVYSVKCKGDIVKRTVLRLCALPVDKT